MLSLEYLIKLSVSLSIVWLFYQLVLRRLTFYNWNRWYLLGYSLLAFGIPLINISPVVSEEQLSQPEMLKLLAQLGRYGKAGQVAAEQTWKQQLWGIAEGVILLGALFLLLRMLARCWSLWRIRRTAQRVHAEKPAIYKVAEPIQPFSFGGAIFLNPALHTEKELEEIILHEYVHIRQRHTIDVLAGELLVILNWYNPCAWLIRYAIRQNLEFIADDQVLRQGLDRKSYQYHLLKVAGVPGYRLANNFNLSSLKKRIVMMNKMKNTRIHLVKFSFILPLVVVLLLAFRGQQLSNRAAAGASRGSGPAQNAVTAVPSAGWPVTDTVPKKIKLISRGSIDTSRPPLYYVDGVLTKREDAEKISPNTIESIYVTKAEEAVKKFGEKGRNGVIEIFLKKPGKEKSGASIQGTDQLDEEKLRSAKLAAEKAGKDKLDADKLDEEKLRSAKLEAENAGKEKLDAEKLGRVELRLEKLDEEKLRQAKLAAEKSGDGNTAYSQVSGQDTANGAATGKNYFRIQAAPGADTTRFYLVTDQQNDPVWFLDGRELKKGANAVLKPENIASVQVLKPKEAVKKYGDKGINGVIEVTSK